MEFQQKKAIYLQIADYVCEQILKDKWQPSDKIPSIRELAVDIAVNPNTVVRTYAYLEDKKIISMRRGVGYFVEIDARTKITQLKKDHFFQQEMPQFFKAMDLLGISFAELRAFYEGQKG